MWCEILVFTSATLLDLGWEEIVELERRNLKIAYLLTWDSRDVLWALCYAHYTIYWISNRLVVVIGTNASPWGAFHACYYWLSASWVQVHFGDTTGIQLSTITTIARLQHLSCVWILLTKLFSAKASKWRRSDGKAGNSWNSRSIQWKIKSWGENTLTPKSGSLWLLV